MNFFVSIFRFDPGASLYFSVYRYISAVSNISPLLRHLLEINCLLFHLWFLVINYWL